MFGQPSPDYAQTPRPPRRNRAKIRLTTAHCTIVVADIEGFGEPSRTNINQVRVRLGLYAAMQYAFDAAGIPWSSCRREDRGDGVLVLAPADVPKSLFADRLPDNLLVALRAHNASHPTEERMHLRLALHAGEINYDDHGVTSSSITHTFRLLDAQALKDALADSGSVLAIIGSSWFFDEVIRHSDRSRAESYSPADVTNKETTTQAWIRLLGERRLPRRRQGRAHYRSDVRSKRTIGSSARRFRTGGVR